MSAVAHGRVDAQGRLIEAEPQLRALQESAGGAVGGAIAVPQIATLARLAHRLGILVSRCVVAADGVSDLDLWVRAKPDGDEVALSVGGWTRRPARPEPGQPAQRIYDFVRSRGDWLWETDPALRITSVTRDGAETLIGQPLTALFRFEEGEGGTLPILEAISARARFEGQEATLRDTGERVRITGLPLIDGAGRFAGYRGSAFRLEPETPALDAEQAPATDAFGARLDEALRRPLARIISQADSIGQQAEGPIRQDYADYAADIASAGRHLLALIDDLVDLQAIERPDFQPEVERIDLADLSRRAAGLLAVRAADKGVRIDVPANDEALPATGDYRRVLQILVNLIGNAVRHSPQGGMVWVRGEREGSYAVLIVADQGRGIAPADQERIFEKFARLEPADPGGSGLGLYIARRLARAMGGEIAVDSAPGQGARFILTLPAAA